MKFTWKEANWLWIAAITTAAYAAVMGYGLGLARIFTFVAREPDLNEVGDFLAGVFAPVALIWLVAAVLTQRQELNETRDQFTENQKVVDAQLKTIESQNGLLSLQHNQAVESAKKSYRLNLFDKRFQIYEKFVKFGDEYESRDYDDDAYSKMTDLSQEAGFVFDRSIENWLMSIAQQIFDYRQFQTISPLQQERTILNEWVVLENEHNSNLRKEYHDHVNRIRDQFQPKVRQGKFWEFMNVTDKTGFDHASPASC